MLNRQIAQATRSEPRTRLKDLRFQAGLRMQFPLVKDLRRKLANVRVKAPGFFEKQSLVWINGLAAVEDMVERRAVCSIRMAALRRLIELLRITEQDDSASRLRDGDNVCEGHLCGFINEQDVDSL